ncbi:MAG TPA: hypothetical protein ENH62_15075 [Marinobacter sp.]|uniref:Phage terminase large subunit N-terminal domain-containing protein n=1 Tax=marine sediment metagenome TaxID=412755 RepID=A0A0F9P3L2_9ZZZZ|nr:hypothetical protein [Marinobacter sp.]
MIAEPDNKMRVEFSQKQSDAWRAMHDDAVSEVLYGGAKGGGKSVFGALWAYLHAGEIIRKYKITKRAYPIPIGFMGRKRSVDFSNTTLETWKKFIPPGRYRIKEHSKEIIIGDRVKIDFGGLDDPETVNKFNSAEYAFFFIDQAEEVDLDAVGLLRATLRLIINGRKVPGKALFTANPAQCWLKDEFISNPAAHQRFIRALPGDNEWTGQEYIKVLENAFKHRPELLKAYRDGNWDAFEGDDQLISDIWIASAVLADPYLTGRIIACDPARFGDDETVIMDLQGTEILEKVTYGQCRTTKISSRMHEMSRQADNCSCVVDEIGIGAGVVDELLDLGRKTIGFNSSAKPTGGTAPLSGQSPIFYNLRAEAWWTVANMFAEGEISCHNMYSFLRGQLCVPTYYYRNGKILVEAKSDIKARLRHSPDHADCYVMGVYTLKQMGSGGRMQVDDVRRLHRQYGPPVGAR